MIFVDNFEGSVVVVLKEKRGQKRLSSCHNRNVVSEVEQRRKGEHVGRLLEALDEETDIEPLVSR